MRIKDILHQKGHEVVSIGPDRTVLDAMQLLVDRNIGSLLVTEEESVRGIITERDVLRMTAYRPTDFQELRVSDVMTQDLLTAAPGDPIDHVMEVMTRNRIRHLPIVDGDGLHGLVSIGDVVNALRRSVQSENEHLKQYIQGEVY